MADYGDEMYNSHRAEEERYDNDEQHYEDHSEVRHSANDKTVLVESGEHHGSESSGCMTCLSRVPCASLCAWILAMLGLGAFSGGAYIGAMRTRNLLDLPFFLPWIHWVLIAIAAATFVMITVFLVVSGISSGVTPREMLKSAGKNVAGRTLNILMLVLAYLVFFDWLIILIASAVPNLVVVAVWYRNVIRKTDCVDLDYFGLGYKDGEPAMNSICNTPNGASDFDDLWRNARGALMCWATCAIGALLVVLALLHFIICIAGNYKHIKSLRSVVYAQYTTELGKSNDSLPLETKL